MHSNVLMYLNETFLYFGRVLQEDVPDEFATLIVNFISRNRIGPHGIEVGVYIYGLLKEYFNGLVLQFVFLFKSKFSQNLKMLFMH